MARRTTALERAARTAQDMTLADVHAVLGALEAALDQMQGSHDPGFVPYEVLAGVTDARCHLGGLLKRRLRNALPDTERQTTPTGRRLRVLVREWGEWSADRDHALSALLTTCDQVADALLDIRGQWAPGLFLAARAAQDMVLPPPPAAVITPEGASA
jgi:hypothetical protein